MLLAKVIGNVVATQKNERYGTNAGEELLALDSVDAGVGDTVVVVREGWSASTAATGKAGAAIDTAIIGVVDLIEETA
jgi:microcompartment protein CcmK/EutM